MTQHRVQRCPCGSPSCKDWHVHPDVAVQGAGFESERVARAVARLLDLLDEAGGSPEAAALLLAQRVVTSVADVPTGRPAQLVSAVQIVLRDNVFETPESPDYDAAREKAATLTRTLAREHGYDLSPELARKLSDTAISRYNVEIGS